MAYGWEHRNDRGYRERHERPVVERGADEVRSWFGDEEAARRRQMDDIRDERDDREWRHRAGRAGERAWERTRDAARDWTDRDRDGRTGIAEFADNDRASYASGYSGPYRDDYWTRERSFGNTARYATADRYATSWRPSVPYGVERVDYTGRGPRGYQRTDERIYEQVCDLLTEDPRIDASDIEVQVKGGEVTLGGSVRTREERRFTEDLIESCSGVREVNNNLKVRPATDVLGTARSGAAVLGLNDTPPPQTHNH